MIVRGLKGQGGFTAIHGAAVIDQFSHGAHLAIALAE
jgi:hypothetical protein